MTLIGSHATVTGGLATGSLAYAAEVGAEVIQVFVSSPRGWAAGPGDPGQDTRLRESGLPVFIPTTYLVNLGSASAELAGRSAGAVGHALRRGAETGARGVVVHTGSAGGRGAPARAGPSRCSTNGVKPPPTCCWSRWRVRARCSARRPATWTATWPRWTTT